MRDEETEPMPLGDRRDRRKFVRFDPTLSAGSVLQALVVMGAVFGLYGANERDSATKRLEIDQLKETTKETKADVRDIQRTLNQMNLSLAELKSELKKEPKP